METSSLEIRPIAGALGAEIAGVDLSGDLDRDMIAAIRQAWLDHLVIFFRGQALAPERFLAFSRHFGEVIEYPFITASRVSPRSPWSSSSSTRGSISAVCGIPTRPTSNARRWGRC